MKAYVSSRNAGRTGEVDHVAITKTTENDGDFLIVVYGICDLYPKRADAVALRDALNKALGEKEKPQTIHVKVL